MSGIRRNLAGIYFKTVACTKTNEIVIESENKSVREQIYMQGRISRCAGEAAETGLPKMSQIRGLPLQIMLPLNCMHSNIIVFK